MLKTRGNAKLDGVNNWRLKVDEEEHITKSFTVHGMNKNEQRQILNRIKNHTHSYKTYKFLAV